MAKRSRWRTKEAVKLANEAGLKALRIGAEAILTEAIDETPVDTGTLRRSGTVTIGKLPDGTRVYEAAKAGNEMKDAFPEPIGKEKAVYVSFSTPYARRQHEELGYEHPVGGKAKYLEDPFNRNKKKVLKYADKHIKKALREAD
ncbi:MAG: hypothetical protein HPY66_3164 [Firmicutes bacterium]|nr:hypothetical protein [Bacillota bacterium]